MPPKLLPFINLPLKTWLRKAGTHLLFAAIYFALARLGLLLATINQSSSPVWHATGFAFFCLFLFGRKFWPAIALGAFTANLATDTSLMTVLTITLGNTLEAILGSALMRATMGDKERFPQQSETIAILLASVFSTAVSASLGTGALLVFENLPKENFSSVWLTWWVGDALGGLVVTPTLIAFVQFWRLRTTPSLSPHPVLRTLSLLVCALIIGFVFFHPLGSPLIFLIFPALLIATLYLGTVGSRLFSLFICVLAIFLTVKNQGPFINSSLNDNLMNLQLFLASIAITIIMIDGFKKTSDLRTPSIVLVLGWLLSGGLFYSFYESESAHDRTHFKELASDLKSRIENRITAYEDVLLGGVGLYGASNNVNHEEWKSFLQTIQVTSRYPGINGIGVVWPVKTKDLNKFVSRIRAQGLKEFTVHSVPNSKSLPRSPNTEHFIITFIEPLETNRQALGLDLASEQARKNAALMARDMGRPAITAKINLVQDSLVRPGFLLFYPFYSKNTQNSSLVERRRHFSGWVYAPFIAEHFFKGLLNKSDRQIAFCAYDSKNKNSDSVIFCSDHASPESHFEMDSEIPWGQGHLTLALKRSPDFISSHDTTAAWVGLCGAIISLLLAALVYALENLNQKTKALAQKKAAQFEQSENRFNSIAQTAQDAIISTNSQGKIISWNRAAETMFGYSESFALGKPLTLITPQQSILLYASDDTFAKTHNSTEHFGRKDSITEMTGQHQSGMKFPIEISISKWESSHGVFFAAIIRDISERQKAIATLQEAKQKAEQEQFFSASITDLAPQKIYILDLASSKLTYINRDFAEEFETSLIKIQSEEANLIEKLVHPEDLSIYHNHFSQFKMMTDSEVSEFTIRLKRKNGDWRWHIHRERIFKRDDNGRIKQIIGIAQDITELKTAKEKLKAAHLELAQRAEMALRESQEKTLKTEQQLLTVMNHTPFILWAIDTEGRFTLLEGKGLESVGLKPGQLVGESAYEWSKNSPEILEYTRRALNGEAITAVVPYENTGRWYQTHYSPIKSSSGAISGVVGVSVDVTEKKESEILRERERQTRQSFIQLQRMIQETPVAMAMFDRQMKYIAYSKTWLTDYNILSNDLV